MSVLVGFFPAGMQNETESGVFSLSSQRHETYLVMTGHLKQPNSRADISVFTPPPSSSRIVTLM
jgi:hypothetical protein